MQDKSNPSNPKTAKSIRDEGYAFAGTNCQEDLSSALSATEGILTLLPFYEGTEEYDRLAEMLRACLRRIMQILTSATEVEEKPANPIKGIAAASLLDLAMQPYRRKIAERSILITRTVNQRVPWFGDAHAVVEILKHLISNAVAFSDPGKTEKWIHIDVQVSTDKVCVEVSDNGIGIEPLHQPRIFEAFYRGSEQSKGLGLGLFTASRLAELLNTVIHLDSSPGHGTAMRIVLPNHIHH